ncbi:MAG: hypothetical protein EBU32_13735, partial [Opitutaceae bacterium]|nr:hypothetical protein [Opitutaceae bacterium]
ETVPVGPWAGAVLGTEGNQPFAFQWDISKVSESGQTKKQATNEPCSYHCEFELRNKLVPVEDKQLEQQLNHLLVDLVLARIRTMAGSYIIEKTPGRAAASTPEEKGATLPPPVLVPLPPARLSPLAKNLLVLALRSTPTN